MIAIDSQKFQYLLVGGVNTIFGYVIGVGAYTLLSSRLNIVYIGIISNIISITLSFFTYKIFVFKTKGRWISEYLKAYLVYGSMAIIGVIFLWFFVDICSLSIWLAQALIILMTVALSYIGHANFTFKRD